MLVSGKEKEKEKEKEKQIIGFMAGTYYYYFRPILFTPKAYARLIHQASLGYSLLTNGFMKKLTTTTIYYLYHDPMVVNAAIRSEESGNEKSTASRVQKALLTKYAYQIFVSKSYQCVRQRTRSSHSEQINQAYHNFDNYKVGSLDVLNKSQQELLLPEDNERIKIYIDQFSRDFDKNKLIGKIKTSIFKFDNKTLRELADLTKGYSVMNEEQKNVTRKKAKKKITKATRVSQSDHLDMLVSDFCNPLKREELLVGTLPNEMQLSLPKFGFNRSKSGVREDIYVLRQNIADLV